jgi:hypothetical protein
MEIEIFNPLDKRNLAKSIANAITSQAPVPLGKLETFDGAGIYALYYLGDFEYYRPISIINKKDFRQPIYAGKAVPEGARKGGMGLDVPSGPFLYKRLNEHRKSIEAVKNLRIEDFYCRYLIVDDIWIPLGESLLIEIHQPLWNYALDGFGNHDPGSGRYNQQISPWDTLHPGRQWASKLQPGKSIADITSAINDFFKE